MSRKNVSRPRHSSTGSASSVLPPLGGTQPRISAGHGVIVEATEKVRFQGKSEEEQDEQEEETSRQQAASPMGSLATAPTCIQSGTAPQIKFGSFCPSPPSSSVPSSSSLPTLTTQSLPGYLPSADDNAGEDSEAELLQEFERNRRDRSKTQIDHSLLQRPVLRRESVDNIASLCHANTRRVPSQRPHRRLRGAEGNSEPVNYKKVPFKLIRQRPQSQSETERVNSPDRSAQQYTTWPIDGISYPVEASVVGNPDRSAPVEATTSATDAWSRRRLKKALKCAPLDHANYASKTSARNSAANSTSNFLSTLPRWAVSQEEGVFSEHQSSDESVMLKIRPGRLTHSPEAPRDGGHVPDASLLGETPVLNDIRGASQGFKPEILAALPPGVDQRISAEDMRKRHKTTEVMVQYMGWDSSYESMRTDRHAQSDSDAKEEEDKWGDLVGDIPCTSVDVPLKSSSERPEKDKMRFCPPSRPLLSRLPVPGP